ncbi:hypothetical protein BaRGS_00010386 [Batillaria attramentaria]|uniref:Uncharacterized protein n=1 Tax=Batillaria attramentaria TaxID=370345 RepID=A0ABD0LHB4_9CAEN
MFIALLAVRLFPELEANKLARGCAFGKGGNATTSPAFLTCGWVSMQLSRPVGSGRQRLVMPTRFLWCRRSGGCWQQSTKPDGVTGRQGTGRTGAVRPSLCRVKKRYFSWFGFRQKDQTTADAVTTGKVLATDRVRRVPCGRW